jgi:hypothetical protein
MANREKLSLQLTAAAKPWINLLAPFYGITGSGITDLTVSGTSTFWLKH